MQDWIAKLNLFLLFNDYKLLEDAKRVGAEVAKFLLKKSLQKYRIIQDQLYKSDFDKLIKASKNGTDNKMKG
ncbi:hypothetical protein [Wolbachia endosymbiont of Brugia pahangi]|uniref:hypothetical protein n=2 Tax=unclassified Wolbachia TaxID=2640676 RepID=UPI0014359B61|nr:hypothetical protein [Wolbachia endosymbiont of Brugia pahangi]QIT36022.1 virulence RhuM family protein [Wolbachia endosymbiont of Brugia pahangi]